MTNSRTIDNTQDTLDVRDIIERYEELESTREALKDSLGEHEEAYAFHDSDDTKSTPEWAALVAIRKEWAEWEDSEEAVELALLSELLEELKGNGGDEQWRGDWYPITLIRDSYFVDAMKELCEDIGDVPPKGFPDYMVIDWEATAENLRVDYSAVEFDGVTYWYR